MLLYDTAAPGPLGPLVHHVSNGGGLRVVVSHEKQEVSFDLTLAVVASLDLVAGCGSQYYPIADWKMLRPLNDRLLIRYVNTDGIFIDHYSTGAPTPARIRWYAR
jgi:hypothetical protein